MKSSRSLRTVFTVCLAAALVCGVGCRRKQTVRVVVSTAPAADAGNGSAPTDPPSTAVFVPQETAPAISDAETTAAAAAAPGPAPELPPAETTSGSPAVPAVSDAAETVALPIELPAANGEMQVSTDPANPFIRAVSRGRGVDAARLAALYAVPASGQNYVFEFTSSDARSEDTLRRVYLLDDGCVIRYVASSSAWERESLSLTENWFCMNVLIKKMILPVVLEGIR